MAKELCVLRVVDACRAVPDAFVPDDLLVDEPIITGSLELVMQSVTILLAEAVERLKSLESAAKDRSLSPRPVTLQPLPLPLKTQLTK